MLHGQDCKDLHWLDLDSSECNCSNVPENISTWPQHHSAWAKHYIAQSQRVAAALIDSKMKPLAWCNFSAQHFKRFFDGPSSEAGAFWHKWLSLSAVLLGKLVSSAIGGLSVDEEIDCEAKNKLRTEGPFEDMTSGGHHSHVLFVHRHLQNLLSWF